MLRTTQNKRTSTAKAWKEKGACGPRDKRTKLKHTRTHAHTHNRECEQIIAQIVHMHMLCAQPQQRDTNQGVSMQRNTIKETAFRYLSAQTRNRTEVKRKSSQETIGYQDSELSKRQKRTLLTKKRRRGTVVSSILGVGLSQANTSMPA